MSALTGDPPPERLTIDAGGVPLSAVLYRPVTAPAGALLVCHGAGSRKENHAIMAEQAVAAGLAALTFDFRGHGESGGVMDAAGSDDVLAATESLRRRSGAPWVAARGASMGAMLLVLAARRRPGLLRSLVLLCPADGPSLLRGLDRSSAVEGADGPGGTAEVERLADDPRADDTGPRYGGRFDDTSLRPFLTRLDLVGQARGLRRVLLAHARDDDDVPFEHSRRLAAVLAPPSRFIALDEGGHHGPGRSPEVARATLEWVAAHGAGR